MMKATFGKGFARAMAAVGAAGTAAAAAVGAAGEGQHGTSSISVSVSGGSGSAHVSAIGTGAAPGATSGVLIVGDKLWIDGREIEDGMTAYTAPNGRNYRIHREDGRVSVTTE